jgi:hypothetical protein
MEKNFDGKFPSIHIVVGKLMKHGVLTDKEHALSEYTHLNIPTEYTREFTQLEHLSEHTHYEHALCLLVDTNFPSWWELDGNFPSNIFPIELFSPQDLFLKNVCKIDFILKHLKLLSFFRESKCHEVLCMNTSYYVNPLDNLLIYLERVIQKC